MKPNQRVLVIYDPVQAGITYYVRGSHFQEALGARGWRLDFLAYTPPAPRSPRRAWRELAIARRARTYGLVYLLKVSSLSLVQRLQRLTDSRIVFDLTDSLWKTAVGGGVWDDLGAILTQADAVFTCNPYDTDYGKAFNPNTTCLPPYANTEEFQRIRHAHPRAPHTSLRLGWIGSGSTIQAIARIAGPLDRAAASFPNIELRVVGWNDKQQIPSFRHLKVSLGPKSYDQATMIREVLEMDIGLYPPPFDLDDYCVRGPLKALIYMAGSVPCICQRAGECARIIEDGKTGMLADRPEEWETKLARLIQDPALRTSLGQAGSEIVRTQYSFTQAISRLEEAFRSVLRMPKPRSGVGPLLSALLDASRALLHSLRHLVSPGVWRRHLGRRTDRDSAPGR